MIDDEAKSSDEVKATVAGPTTGVVRKTYVVISEAGLFKNGKQIDKGSTVELDETTAALFLEAGDIEDAKD